MRALTYAAAVLLAVLHQDFWYWTDSRLFLGFLPAGLAYHVVYTVVVALFWAVALRAAWPHHLERMAESAEADTAGAKGGPSA